MRDLFAFVLRRPWLNALALWLPAMAGAEPQATAGRAPAAAPAADHAPVAHRTLSPMPPLPDADVLPTEWRAAHQAVASFPRGHADIVRWEASQGSAAATAQPQHHQGHKP